MKMIIDMIQNFRYPILLLEITKSLQLIEPHINHEIKALGLSGSVKKRTVSIN